MFYLLAALAPAPVFQDKNIPVPLLAQVASQPTSLPNTTTNPARSPVSSPHFHKARSLSTGLIESMLGATTPSQSLVPTTPAQSLVQGGSKPSLEAEPSQPNEQPFQPQSVPLEPIQRSDRQARSAPGISILTPSAYGQSWGSASIGLGFQSRTRFTDTADGVLGVGFGLGDAQKAVGLDVGLTLVDLDPIENIVQSGAVSFKLHRRLPDDFAVAVGVKNLIRFGRTDSATGYYGVITKRFRLQEDVNQPFSQLFVSAGVGSGQFRSELDINRGSDAVGVFGSVALRVAEPISAIAEWSGQDLSVGLSLVPFRDLPLVITPAFTDITGTAGDGSRFILGIGWSISF